MIHIAPSRARDYSPNDLLTPKETAEYLKRSEKTLANERCKGQGAAWVRVGKRSVRYRFADIESFIAESTRAVA